MRIFGGNGSTPQPQRKMAMILCGSTAIFLENGWEVEMDGTGHEK